MKISNSKKELARIISENGGWCDGAEWASQDRIVAFFSGSKPAYDKTDRIWCSNGDNGNYISSIESVNRVANWHQTILSSEEYFHLYPAHDADGWIEFDGTERPSGYFNKMIDVKLHDGRVLTDSSGRFEWDTDGPSRIIAYRLHKPEQSNHEFCESVMRSIPEPEVKPTIEQLAADYRNLLDFAQRKQQEADSAKADADARLAAFVSAVKAVGLIPVDIVKPALDACMQLVDMVPTRLQSHQDESVAAIGYVVNVERLYDKVRDAVDSLK